MAKKKTRKKHSFQHNQTGLSAVQAPAAVAVPSSGTVSRAADVPVPSYIGGDLRRIAILGTSLVILEFVLWYLMGHTALGPHVYNLVKV